MTIELPYTDKGQADPAKKIIEKRPNDKNPSKKPSQNPLTNEVKVSTATAC